MDKAHLQKLITDREQLRPLSRLARLKHDPWRTLPFYILAALSHLKPFKLTFKTLWGKPMTCYLPEGNTFYYYGYCEANLTNFFLRFVTPGMKVIDAGAHVGFYTMLLSELVDETGEVHSFEPTPWTFNLLTKNTYSLKNVRINHAALADKNGELTFADYGPGYGAYNSAHQAGAPALQEISTKTQVPALTLDNYCRERGLGPDLIKIDTEGFEFEVLTGGKDLFNGSEKPLVTIEVAGGEAWQENRERSFAFLKTAGYLPYEIKVDGRLSPHTLKASYEYDNLLFVPKERLNEITALLV